MTNSKYISLIFIFVGSILITIPLIQMEFTSKDRQNEKDLFEIEVLGSFYQSWGGYPQQPSATVTYTIDIRWHERIGFELIYNGQNSIFLTKGEIWQEYSQRNETWIYGKEQILQNYEMTMENSKFYFLVNNKYYEILTFLELTDDLNNSYPLNFNIPTILNTISTWPLTQNASGFLLIPIFLGLLLSLCKRRKYLNHINKLRQQIFE